MMTNGPSLIEQLCTLEGKTIVVTGACGFLGRHFVRGLLRAGGRVVMISRSDVIHHHCETYVKEFGEAQVAAYQADFYQHDSLDKALQDIVSREQIDVLVNNAYDISARTGFNTPKGTLESSTLSQWQFAFESGIYWAVRTTQLVGTQMRERMGGSIINISSMYGIISPNPRLYEGTSYSNPPSYGVVKAGLLALTRYVASFWGKYNIRCNALVPGAFSNTEDESYNAVPEDSPFLKRLEERTLLNRVGKPRDLLGAVIFLASDASAYVTGQAIIVDGGWTVT